MQVNMDKRIKLDGNMYKCKGEVIDVGMNGGIIVLMAK
jgi:hypothetical protein